MASVIAFRVIRVGLVERHLADAASVINYYRIDGLAAFGFVDIDLLVDEF